MTTLTRGLTAMHEFALPDTDDPEWWAAHRQRMVENMLATPTGQALAALVEAAVAESGARFTTGYCWRCNQMLKRRAHHPACPVGAWLAATEETT